MNSRPVLSKAMEAVCDSLSCPVTVMKAVHESSSCPVTAMEAVCDSQTCPATAPETMKALPVLSVSALPVLSVSVPPRSQILPWFPARSAFLRWSSASVWWSTAQVWWALVPYAPPWWALVPSAPPWWALVPSVPPWWAPVPSASPWWAPGPSAPPWWAPGPSAPPWWAPGPSAPPWWATLPHGPGPPSLPLFRLRSTTLLDYLGGSGSRSLGGGLAGYVTNPGHELLFIHHQRSLTHHIDFLTTQTVTDHSKTAFPIIHCTNTAVRTDHAHT